MDGAEKDRREDQIRDRPTTTPRMSPEKEDQIREERDQPLSREEAEAREEREEADPDKLKGTGKETTNRPPPRREATAEDKPTEEKTEEDHLIPERDDSLPFPERGISLMEERKERVDPLQEEDRAGRGDRVDKAEEGTAEEEEEEDAKHFKGHFPSEIRSRKHSSL